MTEIPVDAPCVGVDFPIHRVNESLVCLDCKQDVPALAMNTGLGQGWMVIKTDYRCDENRQDGECRHAYAPNCLKKVER